MLCASLLRCFRKIGSGEICERCESSRGELMLGARPRGIADPLLACQPCLHRLDAAKALCSSSPLLLDQPILAVQL